MNRFLRLALGFYLLATALGLLLRVAFVQRVAGLDFSHALHAHSHTLYFGWVGLAVFVLAFERVGARGRAVSAVLWSIAAISLASFLSFLEGGYSRASIIISSVALGVWLAAAALWWRRARGRQGVDVAFLRVGVVYLVLAVAAALARVGLMVAKVGGPQGGRLAVFAFLHCFAGFFLFCLMGLLVAEAPRLGARFDEARLRRQLCVMAPLAWLTFPLGVEGGASGGLGLVARAAALVLLYPGALWAWNLWRAAEGAGRTVRGGLRWLAVWFVLKLGMEGAGALGLAAWAVRARHPTILFLHVVLLGVITGGLLLLVLPRLGRSLSPALTLHHLGLAGMSTGLALTSLAGLGLPALVRPGLLLAAAGGGGIVLACLGFTLGAARPLQHACAALMTSRARKSCT
ncbi:hypothetical protein [Pyxidicoccus xibeiensis]|uniref:hypothetical protein n=1 Tax=Pyxidicoccus xibeiensis TaxID=2906759 RepID=UPI0020A736BE|nr:hypothetical protein [Pyxidicoccus xibeiensis]MCP3142057.1 hypothetical protein [Pyxidicoccus xibeiensis]